MSAAGESWGSEREPDPLDREERDEDEQDWQAWVDSPQDPDSWLARWAAANVDYLTGMCLGPAVDVILAGWEAGGTEPPWRDAQPEDTKLSSDGEASPGKGRSAA